MDFARPRERLIQCIRQAQESDGGFRSFSSPDPVRFKESATSYRTSFVASHILIALVASKVTGVDDIKDRIASFLLAQISKTGTANYWARDSDEAQKKPYPDDLDDTACAIAALALHDKTLLDGELLGKLVQALVACEVEPGGPYRTWLVSGDANPVWRDIDPVVNAHLAFAFSVIEIDLPGLDRYLDDAISSKKLSSPYYPDILSALAALSRRPRGNTAEIRLAVERLRTAKGFGNPIADLIGSASLLRLGDTRQVHQETVLRVIDSGQAFMPFAFCIDPAQKGVRHYCGSSALTAALALEALSLIEAPPQTSTPTQTSAERLHAEIVAEAERLIRGFAPAFGDTLLPILHAALEKDSKRQMTLTPYGASVLFGNRYEDVSADLLRSLGLASLFGWLAYTLLDDVMDGDRGSELLPLSAACLRHMQRAFDSVLSDRPDFHAWQMRMMNRVDAANAWELAHCRTRVTEDRIDLPMRLPSFREDWMLYGRSIGHAIGPVAVACSLGFAPSSECGRELEARYAELIAVKQLHDDAHDWETDLLRGQINAVGARLLAELYRLEPNYRGQTVAKSEIQERLRTLFWVDLLPEISGDIMRRCERSIRLLESSSFFTAPQALVPAFERFAEGARQALEGREQTLAFLKTLS